MTVVQRKENENEEQFIFRIGQMKDAGVIELSWDDIAEVVNREFRTDETEYRTEAAYRKPYQQAKRYFEAGVFGDYTDSSKYIEEIQAQKRILEREKIKYRDERRQWNKQNYIEARVEHKLDLLEKQLIRQGRINFETPESVQQIQSENDILAVLSDLHIGATFSSAWGAYNTDIAKDRLRQLLNEILEIQKRHNSENCYVSLQGDLINGNIHKSIQVTNRENVVEQIKIASELISSFCYQLVQHFNCVYLTSVAGNHSRIDKKEDALHDERLDDIVAWSVGVSLKHILNFRYLHNNVDSGICNIDIRGKEYTMIHGDFDKYSKQGVQNLISYLDSIPYAVVYGHKHSCAFSDENGIKLIRSGSLAGSGDQYTIEKRLFCKPSQMICVCNNSGIEAFYPVYLT